MKQLLLLRHAKSSWNEATLDDFDRPLAGRGLKAASLMGRELAVRDWLPDRALVSPALRTRETWRLVSAQLPIAALVEFADALYDASATDLLAEVRQAPETVESLLVLGHNPSLEVFARTLACTSSDAEALRRLDEKFPTAALARFVVDGNWASLSSACLTHCLWPKDLS